MHVTVYIYFCQKIVISSNLIFFCPGMVEGLECWTWLWVRDFLRLNSVKRLLLYLSGMTFPQFFSLLRIKDSRKNIIASLADKLDQ